MHSSHGMHVISQNNNKKITKDHSQITKITNFQFYKDIFICISLSSNYLYML